LKAAVSGCGAHPEEIAGDSAAEGEGSGDDAAFSAAVAAALDDSCDADNCDVD
jgi:hypothetical protein